MQLHEFQSKELFRKSGLPTPQGIPVHRLEEVPGAAQKLKLPIVVKAQVHAGGRGKAGGIKIGKTAEEVAAHAKAILGMTLRTKQTGEAGLKVEMIYLEEAGEIASELYLAILTDRESRSPVIIASKAGGVNIEETAEENPDAVLKLKVDIASGITDQNVQTVHAFLSSGNFTPDETKQFLSALYRAYMDNDATMVEINPVAVSPKGKLVALDAKVTLDDNAAFRHEEWKKFEIAGEKDPREIEAAKFGLNYIKIGDGPIGCMVNGAGLAMATMDVIHVFGSRPANFLDVGGSAPVEAVTAAFQILTSDPDVKVLLVNIFGGIMKCDVIASGIIEAMKIVNSDKPLVVRLEGTNVEKGKEMIRESGLKVHAADDLTSAAKLAIQLAKGK